MTSARDPAPLISSPSPIWLRVIGGLFRLALPLAALSIGLVAYSRLSIESEEKKNEPALKQLLRTSVKELSVTDYPVVVKTNGIVQSHNEVTLSVEVSGRIIRINPLFEVGSYFKSGELLVELDATDYENALAVAKAQALSATSALDLAAQTHDRMRQLIRTNNVSEAELNEAAAQRKQAAAQLDAAQAAVERATKDLERTKVLAPFDGRVRQKVVGLGQLVAPGTPLGIAFAVDFAEVRLPIGARESQFLELPEHVGDAAVDVVLQDAVNPDSELQWQGKIVRTEGALDVDSLELFVIARIDDPFGLRSGQPPLRIGQPVTGLIAGKVLEQVIAIPRSAVRQLDQVYLVDPSQLTVTAKSIDSIWSDEEHVIVRHTNIPDNSLLSTTQLVYVPNGAKVEIIQNPNSPRLSVSTNVDGQSTSAAN
jgi:RND family efflux transporter MFP subunit